MPLTQKFAEEVRKARKARHLTQEQLAELVMVSTRSVQYIEKGAWMPKPETMLRLMIQLQIPADLFSEEVGFSAPVSPDPTESTNA